MRAARASIVQLDKAYWRVFVDKGRDPVTGKRVRISRRVRGTRRDAEDVKTRLLVQDAPGPEITLAEYMGNIHLPQLYATREVLTAETVADRFRLYIDPYLGAERLCAITPSKLRQWLTKLPDANKRFAAFVVLRQILNHAVRDELIPSSPCSKVETPKRPRYEPEVLDAEGVALYLEHFADNPIYPAVLLSLGGGLSRSEIAALDWQDIRPDGTVSVSKGYVQRGSKTYHKGPKTAQRVRTVHLPQFAADRLQRPFDSTGPVLVENGERMEPNRITYLYVKRLRQLPDGIQRVPLKNLRHTSLTLAYDSGADLLTVSRRAGHSTTQITSQYYLRPKGEKDSETARLMDAKLGAKRCQTPATPAGFTLVEEF
jgi:integrase